MKRDKNRKILKLLEKNPKTEKMTFGIAKNIPNKEGQEKISAYKKIFLDIADNIIFLNGGYRKRFLG